KPKNPTSNLANVGLYVFDKCVFDELKKVKVSRRGEYELTDVIGKLGITCAVSCEKVKGYWIPICYAWNLLCANEFFMKDIKEKNEGEVEPNATIKGEVVIGKGTIVKNGTYIEGPVIIGKDCVLGPNCYIRSNTVMGDNCKIGNAVEIKNSILSDSVSIGHLSYIGDSVVGEKVNIAAGNLTANLRHDGKEICTIFCDKKIGTNRRKFGTVIGDHVHTGINTSIYPGRKIWPHLSTMPGEIVKDDKTD
ncbi:glucose-1-phosphate thymidylyltransferase, partial [Candidatus Woesearchaeota archaeon CG11_big_fil_rev_8_21_14_0_20_43_8]